MAGKSKFYKRERNFEILRLRENGMTYAEIAEKYGICRETVRQICLMARRVQKEENRMNIWVVTYWDDGDAEATVTAFDNQEAAASCHKYLNENHDHVAIDEVPLYSKFFNLF